jgi:hypothetical protein
MEALIEFITQNPLYGIGVVALLLFMVFALIKKMFILAIIAIALNAGYVYYLQDIAEDAYARAGSKYESAKEQAENLMDKAGSLIK